jgi:RNA 2',3'-cyclic 3'-phosphodiesterase
MPRLFVAVPLPEAVTQRLSALAGGIPGARWSPPRNMHVTLRFIGDVDGREASDIAAILDEVDGAAFDMAVEGVDVFGGRRDARLLYAGVAPREPLKRLRDKIEAALQRHGLPAEERKYHPHITLARLRGAPADRVGRFLEANGLLMSPPIRVESFGLYDSIRGNDGAVYRQVQHYDLRAE